jgi:hypothetical protein
LLVSGFIKVGAYGSKTLKKYVFSRNYKYNLLFSKCYGQYDTVFKIEVTMSSIMLLVVQISKFELSCMKQCERPI